MTVDSHSLRCCLSAKGFSQGIYGLFHITLRGFFIEKKSRKKECPSPSFRRAFFVETVLLKEKKEEEEKKDEERE